MAVSIQQAAANALATWLQTKLPDVVVQPQWPSPDYTKPDKVISIVTAGVRSDLPLDPRVVGRTNLSDTTANFRWQIAACKQPFQLDIWTTSDVDRDDIMARLDQVIRAGATPLAGVYNPNPVGHGCLIAVQDGWQSYNTIADFSFDEVDTDTTSDTQLRDIYRATYTGDAFFMLTVSAVSARQLVIDFAQRISETDNPSDFP